MTYPVRKQISMVMPHMLIQKLFPTSEPSHIRIKVHTINSSKQLKSLTIFIFKNGSLQYHRKKTCKDLLIHIASNQNAS